MVFRSSWMLIARHQASNSNKWMENSCVNCIWAFKAIPYICLSSWFTTRSVSAILRVVASIPASDWPTWNHTCLSAVMFATLWASSFAAVVIWASNLANMLLGPVALVPTCCNCCHSRCWNNSSKSLGSAGVAWEISNTNRSLALWWSASDHMLTARRALSTRTWNYFCFDVVTFSAPYSWTSIAARIVWIFCSWNWWDALANSSSTLAFADFDIFWSRKAPSFL